MPELNTQTSRNAFSIYIRQNTTAAKIKMMMFRDPLNTVHLPRTYAILKKFLPSVLTTECFNDLSIPFYKEVRRTEIGHLFEHILLEYMCRLKIAKGFRSAVYEGRTRWNWERDPKGLFHIHINCGMKDSDILPIALNKSIALVNIVLQNGTGLENRRFFPTYKAQSSSYLGLKNGKKRRSKTKINPDRVIQEA